MSGFLSAYGAGLSMKGETFEQSCEKTLNKSNLQSLVENMKGNIKKKFYNVKLIHIIRLRYFGSNTVISLSLKSMNTIKKRQDAL